MNVMFDIKLLCLILPPYFQIYSFYLGLAINLIKNILIAGLSQAFLAEQLTLSQPGGQIIPTTVLQAPPDFQTLRRPWIVKNSLLHKDIDSIRICFFQVILLIFSSQPPSPILVWQSMEVTVLQQLKLEAISVS
jgi:hypothetical protein